MLLNNNLHRCGIEVTIIIILYVTRPHQRTRSCRHCTPSKCRRSPAQFHQLHPGSAADSYIHTHPLVSLSLSPVHSPHLLHTRKGTYGLCEAVLIMNNTIYYIQLKLWRFKHPIFWLKSKHKYHWQELQPTNPMRQKYKYKYKRY